ncbi:MAG: trypsin-like peptidase domain-containing protein, partial [Eubacteriales bacterium]|nr:trypsin-like peptidase domain-containing protein [Eubacteriales bacterium]
LNEQNYMEDKKVNYDEELKNITEDTKHNIEMEKIQLDFDNSQFNKIEDTDDKNTSSINNIIISEEIKQEKAKKAKKVKKACVRFLTTASCFAFLGAGIGSGYILAKNTVTKYEQDNFKFDNSNTNLTANEISLTSNSISGIFEEVGDSVVNISTISSSRNIFSSTGSGSGIIYKIDGDTVYIITNNHVIENASTMTISVTGQEQIPAKLIGADPSSDIAVIAVSQKAMQQSGIQNVTVAKFADSDQVKVGEFVFPIGNALGRGKTITQGIISAQNKEINIDGKKLTVLQTDAAINPGNSGGALINSKGEVVGVNTAKLSNSAIEGIGYAIPTNKALDVAKDIIENGSVQKPYLGIQGETITEEIKMIFNLKTNGVLITNVEEGSSAYNAGIVPTDIITSFNGEKIETLEDLSNAIKNVKVNDVVKVGIIRNGFQEMTIEVTFIPANNFMY